MSTRRFHSKSRRGCQQCKQRKAKCDETKPVCLRCEKKGDTCSYTHSPLVVIPSYSRVQGHQNGDRGGASSGTTAPKLDKLETERSNDPEVNFASQYALRGDDNDTLRLIHHYALSTCKSISDSYGQVPVWRDVIPDLAFQHDFLLSGLLAVTSLHLGLLLPSNEHYNSAVRHHTNAITLYRPHLVSINSDNATALFTLSILLALYSFGVHDTPLSKLSPLLEIQEIFKLLRGVSIVVQTGAHWLEQGPVSSFMLPEPAIPSAPLTAPGLECTLARLSVCTQETPMDTSSREAYTGAIAILRQGFLNAQECPYPSVAILRFPIFVPLGFLEELEGRKPLALIILAHYAVLLHRGRNQLWLKGWGQDIVDGVRQVLGEEWKQLLEWPITEIERQPQTSS